MDVDWTRNNNEEGQGAPAREGQLKDPGGQHAQARAGKIIDPGGGGDIDIGGLQTNFEKCVDTWVNHEVQELNHHRSIKEEAEETRNKTQMNNLKGYRKMSKEEIQMEMDLRGPDGTGPKQI